LIRYSFEIDVQEDLREMGIKRWRRKALDRDQWRRIAQEAKGSRRAVAPSDDAHYDYDDSFEI
jgi:hypothetical protein